MAEFSDLSLRWRLLLASYPWRRVDPVPWQPGSGDPAAMRVGLVTTAGLYRPGVDPPFERRRGGDVSFRVLPDDVPLDSLALGQTSEEFDRTGIERDRNLAYPRDRLRELRDAGEVGSVSPVHLSFNGSITAPGRLVARSAPEAAEVFRKEMVDAALLVPV